MEKYVKMLKDKLGTLFEQCVKHNAILAGGSIADMFCDRKVNDYDLYFRTPEDAYDVYKFLHNQTDNIVNISKRALTFDNCGSVVQLVFMDYYNTPEELFDNFDFTVCMGAYDFANDKWCFSDRFVVDNCNKRIVVNKNTPWILNSFDRVDKYIEKGYKIEKRELLKMGLLASKIESSNVEQLKENLQGIYKMDISECQNVDNVIDGVENDTFKMGFYYDVHISNNIVKKLMWHEEIKTSYIEVPRKSIFLESVEDKKKVIFIQDSDGLPTQTTKINFLLDTKTSQQEFPIDIYKICLGCSNLNEAMSIYNNNFRYYIGKDVEDDKGVFANLYQDIIYSTYFSRAITNPNNYVIVKLKLQNKTDIKDIDDEGCIKVKKALCVEIVPFQKFYDTLDVEDILKDNYMQF